jgi:hypothetical protein
VHRLGAEHVRPLCVDEALEDFQLPYELVERVVARAAAEKSFDGFAVERRLDGREVDVVVCRAMRSAFAASVDPAAGENASPGFPNLPPRNRAIVSDSGSAKPSSRQSSKGILPCGLSDRYCADCRPPSAAGDTTAT